MQNKKYSEQHLDVLSALSIVERAMYGPTTKDRRLVIRLALSMANQGRTFRDDEYIALLVRKFTITFLPFTPDCSAKVTLILFLL